MHQHWNAAARPVTSDFALNCGVSSGTTVSRNVTPRCVIRIQGRSDHEEKFLFPMMR
jgi:hypothetical protein